MQAKIKGIYSTQHTSFAFITTKERIDPKIRSCVTTLRASYGFVASPSSPEIPMFDQFISYYIVLKAPHFPNCALRIQYF